MGHSGRKNCRQRGQNRGRRIPDSRDEFVTGVQRSLDIESNPINEWKDRTQLFGIGARCMKTDPIAECADLVDCLLKKWLRGGLSTAEYNSIEKTSPFVKKSPRLFPGSPGPLGSFSAGLEGSQVGIMAIATFPRTALKKEDCSQGTRKVNSRKRNEAGELEFLFPG